MILIPILNNISLLVTLVVSYVLIIRYFDQSTLRVQLFNGLLFGSFVIIGMYNSVEIQEGLIFDGRSIVLSVAGLYGGPITAAVAFIMAFIYRVWIGGPGVIMGSLVIIEATIIGIVFHFLVKGKKDIITHLLYLLMGIIVHGIMLILVMFLPGNMRMEVFLNIALPVLVVYPIGSMVMCMFVHSQLKYIGMFDELLEGESRFRDLFYQSHLVYLIIDPETKDIVNANKVAEQFYGYSREELLSMNISGINVQSEKEINLSMSIAFENYQNRFVVQHKLSSGELRDVEVFAGPVSYGGKTLVYSVVTDITDRQKVENKLRESELSYRGLFDAVKDAIYIQDKNGVFLDVNPGAEKMYGYTKKDFIGNDPSFLSAPGMNDLQKLSEQIQMCFNGQEVEFEFWGIRKDGSIFPKYVRLFKGKYFGEDVIIAIGHDITHRKKAQKEIEESRFDLKTLINVSDDVIILLDFAGYIITHNKTFSDYYSFKGNYIGADLFSIFPSDVADERKKYFKNVLETRKPISFEDFSIDRDWWVTYYPILDKNSNVDRVAVYARDITVQRKMFNLQKNLQVAEKSAQLKQQFLSNMSHEMRTPMNGIIGMTELFARTELTDVQKDFLSTIRESSNTLLSLINDVLDLARFESGKIPLNVQNINVNELEQKIINLFKQSAISQGLGFKVDFSSAIPENIIFDERRLMQIIINLMGNALKFTHLGEISIKADVLNKHKNKLTLKFWVNDTGIGIDKDFLPLIFDEFAQLDNSKTRKYEGSGLGLAICKKVVEFMGGTIGVDSVKGKGSSFWFTIKTEESVDGVTANTKSGNLEFAPLGLNVLMVEDKIINRKVASLILKNMGCVVDTAENGLVGVDKVRKNQYDVVLMDVQMPVMDGITAVQTIRKNKSKQPYIIGLSAEAMEGDAEKYIGMGMDDYLTKPLIPDVLYEKLLMIKNNKK
jgi:PAS domain S-box-containing protein